MEDVPVLAAIQEAEEAVRRRIREAEARSNERLAEARRRADALRNERETGAAQALADLAELARSASRRDAERIVREAEDEAAAFMARTRAMRDYAADRLIERVLPFADTGGEQPQNPS